MPIGATDGTDRHSTDDHNRPAGERLAFLWTTLGALVGSAVVAGLFLAFLALLP
ncbi:hypothetical protein [Pseudonocardia parietis]|uniref:Uncharacterized protein n=1 Tax=Pseudonocardia parietis TaxID=570936 RepID=A0ABS4VPT3_9PSEU|nr:hypothetical protein [Pseudonocardia parietis]MBP2365932.1 hypothetical protein [Pseudonocardia parietis]